MSPEMEMLIREAMAKIGEGVGQGADYVWPLAVREVYISGIINLIFTAIGVGLLAISPRLIRWHQKEDKSFDSEFGYVSSATLSVLGPVIGFGFVILSFPLAIRCLFNSEYHALLKAMELLGVGG